MSTLLANAPTQDNSAAWKATRVGRFTASTIGKLMTEKRTLNAEEKAHKAAGGIVFGDTALTLIASKAGERMACASDYSASTRSTDRGTLLEHGARILLGRHWMPVDGITWQAYGDNSGATPDGFVQDGTATVDFKCPESFAQLVQFASEVPDGDFDALERWDKTYAWQVMHQAKCAGVKYGWLVYFTDRMPLVPITPEQRDEVQAVIDHVAYRLGELTLRPWEYRYASDGFAYVARRFELTEERSQRIDRVLACAEIVCTEYINQFRA